ncbi:limd1 [Corchorus olitorius]|uniref:Limd1 n=1 Tax=Corchorus olitorius TaxID=93759 RepID=A0A1R3J6R1_9ROSI|nr:limd1 [Corchorus olitorius]
MVIKPCHRHHMGSILISFIHHMDTCHLTNNILLIINSAMPPPQTPTSTQQYQQSGPQGPPPLMSGPSFTAQSETAPSGALKGRSHWGHWGTCPN